MKGPTGKAFDGIYSNSRFIHSAASLVGSVVNIQVKNGSMYEGVFRTFSQKVDFVLEMVHKVDVQKGGQFFISDINPKDITEKMIFSFQDVVMLSAVNIDLDFAAQDTFTDTAISKFNGQVQQRELEPWDGGLSATETATDLEATEGDVTAQNGWDPVEMFQTNEEKFGVKSSFDSNLHDYTIPLKKQNTDEYKTQEAKAAKLAQEIESGIQYKNRLALENGDEEEKYSSVVRPDNPANNNMRFTVHRGKKIQARPARSSPSPTVTHSNNRVSPHQSQQNYHKMTSPNSLNNNSQNKITSVKPVSPSVHSPSSKPVTPPSMTLRQPSSSPSQNLQQHVPDYQTPSGRNVGQQNPNMQNAPLTQATDNRKLNNGDSMRTPKENLSKDIIEADIPHKTSERPKEVPEKKPPLKKPYENSAAQDLKKFHEKFKLDSKEVKDNRKEPSVNKKPEPKTPDSPSEVKQSLEQKPKEEKESNSSTPESNIPSDASKSSLNPNAKEFILNPNAKAFTPRTTIPMQTNILPTPPPPPVQPPPRLHAQSPVIAVPQHPLVPSMHPMFTNMTPHYVLPATPVSMPVGTPYTPATSIAQQAPRFRKTLPVSLTRNDSSQSIHVQAATGQPILAPPTVPAPQFAIQYHSPSVIHSSGPPQPQIAAYAQMYQMVGPRMIAPQPLGMMPTAGPYVDSQHVPAPIFMNPQAVTGVQHPGGPSGNSGQHSASSTPQSQTPNLHPAPSPVHQQPPPPQQPQHGQPPTPTGHPGNPPTPHVIYHGQLAAQHQLQINPASAGHAHPYQVYNGPQPILMLPQPGHPHHPSTFQALQNHYHHPQSAGPHPGTPNQILPHPPPVQMMPTSTAMGQVPVSNSPYVPHSQGLLTTPRPEYFRSLKNEYYGSIKIFGKV